MRCIPYRNNSGANDKEGVEMSDKEQNDKEKSKDTQTKKPSDEIDADVLVVDMSDNEVVLSGKTKRGKGKVVSVDPGR